MLLRGLYAETLEVLTGGSQAQSRPEREAAATRGAGRGARATGRGGGRGRARPALPALLARLRHPHPRDLRRAGARARPRASRRCASSSTSSRDATQACFAMADHPGIFARLAGALALAGANVVDARTYTTTDGIATAAFWIQDAEGKPYEKARLTRLRNAVTRTLRGEIVAREALKDKDRIKQARARLRGADPDQLRQHRLGHLHHHRGRDPRPAGPALRPRPHADRQQRLDRQRDHRHLRRAGGRRLLRQGPLRPEAARREQAAHARGPAAGGDRAGRRGAR